MGDTGNLAAAAKVHRAIRNGELPRVTEYVCVDCGKPATQYEHRDYNRPLDVEPVCNSCNHKRGPAIPRIGYFAEVFRSGYIEYSSRKRLGQMLSLAGIAADLSGFPGRVTIRHWRQFEDPLLEWEARRASATADSTGEESDS